MRALWLCAWFFPLLATAEIYRWTDEQGKVHFSETPPPGAQRIEVKPQVVERDDATREREERTRRFYDARRDEQAAAQQKAAEQQATQDAQCDRLRHNLSTLSHGGRYFTQGSDGERTYYSDAQIDAARRSLEARLAEGCR
ncbi:DUF4124 domain-containing protein [Pseudomonas sp. ZM23]|uniref:DUF4124 domain-containing protein n=1 Tax=Pseudomonas triclosanedens TaxID=2961893 RepID=A0ABY6ZUM6_9PSED|nr:DUF4124 domain-containing protein [Pseudomonas triclosanedens]MCP8463153.1 DUF4124 domain-containing protein [Pseudomonas triclosanedens]MCP8469788.1 DUF4124 domain-containing protein [Pseudomonas triclosanedens]MCP8473954.1 DUF4124 domain-containing protein [Pseudomonas triclosanedens]WAI48647.1 DUF4124 domain-containing protein [Pseudomonas triclosanedens]